VTSLSYHNPQGNPCTLCGRPLAYHVVEHVPHGSPCRICGLVESQHRIRDKDRNKRMGHKQVGSPCQICGLSSRYHKKAKNEHHHWRAATTEQGYPEGACGRCGKTKNAHDGNIVYLGIDGEGQGRDFHKYVFLACSNEQMTRTWTTGSKDGDPISTEDALDFILRLPGGRHKIFAYAFQYDLTKILTDLGNAELYKLFRPELRQRPPEEAKKGPYPVHWNGYELNLQASKFSVKRGNNRRVIWDIFKFFQGRFTAAIRDWKVGNPALWERMEKMKEQRAEFDKLEAEAVHTYCLEECACMAGLARKLTDAHIQAGLILKNYYGAGSSAGAMLHVMGIKEQIRPCPESITEMASRAFFGGRFENSVIGSVEQVLYGYDISSAYPYELCFLPCLLHGAWEHTHHRVDLDAGNTRQALVRYTLERGQPEPWGPFPFRDENGTISFPIQSGGGWIYRDEYLAGERLFDNVKFQEAWIYKCECSCQPFARIPKYYMERLRIGKEGPGIVIKLGCNSCYGKLAQSVGNAQFNSWLWAGMITSGTRAKLLELLSLNDRRDSVLMMATDGIVTTQKLKTPKPRDTGTYDAHKPEKPDEKLPLGGWEEKVVPKGMFFARPGIYFPLQPTSKEAGQVRGRGVGRKAILDNWQTIVSSYESLGASNITSKAVSITEISRFCGAKSSISMSIRNNVRVYKRADGKNPDPCYGQWITRPVEMSFDPMPKREGIGAPSVWGHAGRAHTLTVRKMPRSAVSAPYDRATSEEARELQNMTGEIVEQPDGDWEEYE
jgi:hypothetical protein